MNDIYVDETSVFYIGTEEVPVVFLENLTDPFLIAGDLINYVEHIDGV